jgi:hypothetical protein
MSAYPQPFIPLPYQYIIVIISLGRALARTVTLTLFCRYPLRVRTSLQASGL